MMKFLFLTDEYYPNFGANSLIVRTLSKELVNRGHKVYVMPASYDKSLPKNEEFEGSTVLRTLPFDGKETLLSSIKQFRWIEAMQIFTMCLGAKLLRSHRLWPKQKIAARQFLKRFIDEQKIDVAISINCSVELSFPLLYLRKRHKLKCKWIWYMLDPFESHEYYRAHTSERKLKRLQHSIMQNCDRIIATDLIYDETSQWEQAQILNKITVAGFPKIEKPQYVPVADDIILPHGKINVVCTGSKNETVRNSAYTLSLCKQIPSVAFHFVGNGWANETKEEDNLYFYPPHSYQSIRNLQQNADFLLNIGNAVDNQLPSKVLEYISTGKPIINIYKTERCPAKALLDRWDALNIAENEDAVEKLYAFVNSNRAKVSFEILEKIFEEFTPACVADIFIK
ncbi:MAG: glycosyltransferase [Clostridia bacterium]|nr:glycosyltransferase [Clostridia bacterium]